MVRVTVNIIKSMSWYSCPNIQFCFGTPCCLWHTAMWSLYKYDRFIAIIKWELEIISICLFCVVSRSLQILWVSPFWKPVPRMPPMWSRLSWPWLLKSRREWGLEPQLEVGKSQMWSWPLALPSSLHREDVAEGEPLSLWPLKLHYIPAKPPANRRDRKDMIDNHMSTWEPDEVACVSIVYIIVTLWIWNKASFFVILSCYWWSDWWLRWVHNRKRTWLFITSLVPQRLLFCGSLRTMSDCVSLHSSSWWANQFSFMTTFSVALLFLWWFGFLCQHWSVCLYLKLYFSHYCSYQPLHMQKCLDSSKSSATIYVH